MLLIDLHQQDVWPGSGGLQETGAGRRGVGGAVACLPAQKEPGSAPTPLARSAPPALLRAQARARARRSTCRCRCTAGTPQRCAPGLLWWSLPPAASGLISSSSARVGGWPLVLCGAGHPRHWLAAMPLGERPLPPATCVPTPPLRFHHITGYDAHYADPLDHLQLQPATFHWLAAAARGLAAELCGGRLLLLLEGGWVRVRWRCLDWVAGEMDAPAWPMSTAAATAEDSLALAAPPSCPHPPPQAATTRPRWASAWRRRAARCWAGLAVRLRVMQGGCGAAAAS